MTVSELNELIQKWVTVLDKDEEVEFTETDKYADVHFVYIVPTNEFPEDGQVVIDAIKKLWGPGEFNVMTQEDFARGPSYIELGAFLGSQQLALMLIGAVDLAGYPCFTPKMLGIDGLLADQMAGTGYSFLNPEPFSVVPT